MGQYFIFHIVLQITKAISLTSFKKILQKQEKILQIIKVQGIMVNVDYARLTADLLERCCVGVETLKRKETSDSARRQDQNLRKIDLERKLMETKCLEENKLDKSSYFRVKLKRIKFGL